MILITKTEKSQVIEIEYDKFLLISYKILEYQLTVKTSNIVKNQSPPSQYPLSPFLHC